LQIQSFFTCRSSWRQEVAQMQCYCFNHTNKQITSFLYFQRHTWDEFLNLSPTAADLLWEVLVVRDTHVPRVMLWVGNVTFCCQRTPQLLPLSSHWQPTVSTLAMLQL
jgi:hypothetical protein